MEKDEEENVWYVTGGLVDLLERKALGLDAHTVAVIFCSSSDHVQMDACSDNTAALMVGVIAADLGASWSAEQTRCLSVWKDLRKGIHQSGIACALLFQRIGTVQAGEDGVIAARGDGM